MSASQLLWRLLLAVPTLIGVGIVVFVLLRVVPGDPIAMMLPPGATAADIERLRAVYGFDKSIVQQFLIWAAGVARGDLGISIGLRQNVATLVLNRLPATLELAALAALVAALLGGGLALLAVWRHSAWIDLAVDAVAGLAQAVPDFLWALLFVLLLGVAVPLLPISGRVDPSVALNYSTNFLLLESVLRADFRVTGDLLAHLALPAASLGLPLAALIAIVLRTGLREAMAQDYVLLATIKGFSRGRILLVEALRNALIPTVALSGVQLTFLIGGTVLVERIFAYPGIGNMAIDAVINRDLPLIQALVLTFALLFIAINLLVDLAIVLLNPRLRHG